MDFLAGVSILKDRKFTLPSFLTGSKPANDVHESPQKSDDSASEPSPKGSNPPANASSTFTRSTRWSSALMSGVDPRTIYGNKRFSAIYDDWDSSDFKRSRRLKNVNKPDDKAAPIEDTHISEDDCDETIVGDGDEMLAILKEIAAIVTTVIQKFRFCVEIPVTQANGAPKASYGTRATSAQLHQQRLLLTGGALPSSRSEKQLEKKHNAVCDDLDSIKAELESIMNKAKGFPKDKKSDLLPYYISEYIALRASYYSRMIRNMRLLETHAEEHAYLPRQFITSLIDIYRRAALGHLEHLRKLIPKGIKRAGILDFRAWRCGVDLAPVAMRDLSAVLQKYNYSQIKVMQFAPHTELAQPASSAQRCALLMQKPPILYKERDASSNTSSSAGQCNVPVNHVTLEQDSLMEPGTASVFPTEETTNSQSSTVSPPNSSHSGSHIGTAMDSPMILTHNQDAFNMAKTEAGMIPSSQGSLASGGDNNAASSGNNDASTPAVSRVARGILNGNGDSPNAVSESWRHLRQPQIFERADGNVDYSIKIPKRSRPTDSSHEAS
ncbi:hypothetical protein BgAZ_402540 [Babesia gibsoni]|uniref:Uncharacterized protein n=1 Tax=Babesia gibsoni TaxID=33632 RepID=A0AAD8LJY6_BABGI|nr:hypothetical protein BgAZ_402540 [Babesia gibsoni]